MNPIAKIIKSKFFQRKRNRILAICGTILFVAAMIFLVIFQNGMLDGLFAPSITLMSPAPVSADDRNEIVIDVVLSSLPDRVFPAASLSVEFDKNKLEFTGVKQGTMMTLGDSNGEKKTYNIPIWKSDIEVSNRLGEINTMYLDITGGKFAYIREGFNKNNKDILLRLTFRFRDSVQAGEIYNITVKDVVIATSGGAEKRTSLATALRTLRAYPAKIAVK